MSKITDTTRLVSHREAKQVALRLIAGSFRRDGERLSVDRRPHFSIPTRVNEDDDCLIIAYIEQQQTAWRTDREAIARAIYGVATDWLNRGGIGIPLASFDEVSERDRNLHLAYADAVLALTIAGREGER